MLHLVIYLHRMGQFWGVFLLLGLALLVWAAFVHPDWQRPRTITQRLWLKRLGWGMLVITILTALARNWVLVDAVRY